MDNRSKKLTMLVCLVLGCIVTSYVSTSKYKEISSLDTQVSEKKPVLLEQEKVKNSKSNQEKIVVQVSGAVVRPGIYILYAESRAEDAIAMAGGALENAKLDRVNVAKKLKDGMHIYVPFKKNSGSKTNKVSENYKNESVKSRTEETLPVDVNVATQQELETIPGVGPVMAQRIIAGRKVKPYRNIEDLMRIKGISKSKLDIIKKYVKV